MPKAGKSLCKETFRPLQKSDTLFRSCIPAAVCFQSFPLPAFTVHSGTKRYREKHMGIRQFSNDVQRKDWNCKLKDGDFQFRPLFVFCYDRRNRTNTITNTTPAADSKTDATHPAERSSDLPIYEPSGGGCLSLYAFGRKALAEGERCPVL